MTREEFIGLCDRYNTVKRQGRLNCGTLANIKNFLYILQHERGDNVLDIKNISISVTNDYRSNTLDLKHTYKRHDKAELFLYENMLDRLICALEEYVRDCEFLIEESSFPGDSSE